MALNYTAFQQFPLQIIGISSDYNAKITAIENFVVADLSYTGDAGDIEAILPYFVFWFFCQDEKSSVVVEVGENSQIKEFSFPEITKQVMAWDLAVEMLLVVCENNGTSAKAKYLKKCNFFI